MTEAEVMTLDFHVTQVVDADWDRIDVYCPGTGLAPRKRFLRGSVSVNERLDPYALVAQAWFSDHPPKPKVWKVGDIVPRNTQVGKDWTAAPFRTKAEAGPYTEYGTHPMNVDAQMMCREDREILWIAP